MSCSIFTPRILNLPTLLPARGKKEKNLGPESMCFLPCNSPALSTELIPLFFFKFLSYQLLPKEGHSRKGKSFGGLGLFLP